MSIKARRGLLLVALMVVVSALVLSVGVSSPTEAQTASVPSPAPISGNVSVKATFLHAGAGDAPAPPRVVDLSAASYKPGDTLRISYKVAPSGFSYFGCQGPFERTEDVRLLGVFSSSSALLASSESARVPGAIDAGEDISVEPTWPNNEPVDIPQDFRVTPPRVTPPSEFLIKIPPSATHLFLGIADSYYFDNCGTGADFVIETAPDTTAPAIDAHSDLTEEATGPDGATVNYTKPAANDAVDGSVDVNCTPDSGSIFELGDTTVSCMATDDAGNSSQNTFKVTVEDTTSPTLDAHADVSATATSSSGAVVNYANPTASDLVDGNNVAVNCSPSSGDTFPLGTTQVNCSATDRAGNKAEENFKVSVTYAWSGTLQPINGGSTPEYSDDTSVSKLGSTVPVKFTLTDASAGISGPEAKLYAAKVTNEVVGTEVETTSTATASSGNLFRYDATNGQYVFNWSTKGLTAGTYQLRIDLADVASRTVRVSLK
jgi:hypothetical protein